MATLVKQYVYQVYSGSTGAFLGSLPNVKSEFAYNQNINSAGCQMEIVLSASFDDVGAVQTSEYWLDESGNKIVDESGNRIVWSAVYNFNTIPIDLGNRVKVYRSDDTNPAGTVAFDGIISKWSTDYAANTVTLTVLSWGVQLDNFIINTDPTGQSIDQEVYDTTYSVSPKGSLSGGTEYAQSFNLAAPTIVGSILVFMSGSASFTRSVGKGQSETIIPLSTGVWELYSGTPTAPGSLVDTGNFNFTGATVRQVNFALTKPQSLTGNYFLWIHNYSGGSIYYGVVTLQATTTNPYAGGTMYSYDLVAKTWTQIAGSDLAFVVQSSTGSNQLTFTNNDPGTIIKRILDQLSAQGGRITYTDLTVLTTGTIVSYNYKTQTILEGIQKMLQLSPAGYYWYPDPATNYLYFRRTSNSADHTFVLGKHISALNIEYSLEQVINSVYFSGGPTASVNLYNAIKNSASVQKYGQWLERMSDNRVTDSTTANVIINGELNNKSSPLFLTTVEILASDYDIETIDPGEMVAFRNFNNLIDTLVFQIVALTRTPDKITLNLGTLPPRQSAIVNDVQRRLDLLETIANPSTPS